MSDNSHQTRISPHMMAFFEPPILDIMVDATKEDIERAILELKNSLEEGCVGYDKMPNPIFWDNSDQEQPKTISVRWAFDSNEKVIDE